MGSKCSSGLLLVPAWWLWAFRENVNWGWFRLAVLFFFLFFCSTSRAVHYGFPIEVLPGRYRRVDRRTKRLLSRVFFECHVFHPLFNSISVYVCGEEGSWKSNNVSEMIVAFLNMCIQTLGNYLEGNSELPM